MTSLSKPGGRAFDEQNPPHSINPLSGACMARLSGMASIFSSKARQAIQGLMRENMGIKAVDTKGPLFSRS